MTNKNPHPATELATALRDTWGGKSKGLYEAFKRARLAKSAGMAFPKEGHEFAVYALWYSQGIERLNNAIEFGMDETAAMANLKCAIAHYEDGIGKDIDMNEASDCVKVAAHIAYLIIFHGDMIAMRKEGIERHQRFLIARQEAEAAPWEEPQPEINKLQVGDVVTLTNPEGTFTVTNRYITKEGKETIGGFHKIELKHTAKSLNKHPLPPAIAAMGDKVKCHAILTLQKKGWVYGSHDPKPGQDFGDCRLVE